MFGFVGVGVNLRPLSKSLVSVLLSFLEDKFTICISVLHAIFCCVASCRGTKNYLNVNLDPELYFYQHSGGNYIYIQKIGFLRQSFLIFHFLVLTEII